MERNYTRADIMAIGEKVYSEVGGKRAILQRIEYACEVLRDLSYMDLERTVYRFESSPYREIPIKVYDYGDENATTALVMLHLSKAGNDEGLTYGRDFRDILLALAKANYFTQINYCDRAWDQGGMTNIAHAWMYMKKSPAFHRIFNQDQEEKIEEWMRSYARLLIEDKDNPLYQSFRPYDNQELGIGCLVMLAEVLKERDPHLTQELMALADSKVVGWARKTGNPDDTLFYTPIWAKAMYFYATSRSKTEWLTSKNCTDTFESYLEQMPSNGLATLYNWMFLSSYPDMMALGAHILKDGRYKWMANRLLQERLEERPVRTSYVASELPPKALKDPGAWIMREEIQSESKYDHIWEGRVSNLFHLWLFWDDELPAVKPESGSLLLMKSAGSDRYGDDPGPNLPDKIAFREGWERDSLFALLNLRGIANSPSEPRPRAHRYPGANEIITVTFEEPFAVQDENIFERDWALHRWRLNAFNIKRDGEWLDGLEKCCNSTVNFFRNLSMVDVSKTILPEYYDWTNERVCALVKGGYLTIFDYAYAHFGRQPEEIGVRWHLKGDYRVGRERTDLELRNRQMTVLYPNIKGQWLVHAEENTEAIPIYQHKPSVDLDLIAKGRRAGFITSFHPVKRKDFINVEDIDVKDLGGRQVYPLALAIRVRGSSEDLIGSRMSIFARQFDYEGLRTNAEFFISRRSETVRKMDFVNGDSFTIETPQKTSHIELNGERLPQEQWQYFDGTTCIHLPSLQSGTLLVF